MRRQLRQTFGAIATLIAASISTSVPVFAQTVYAHIVNLATVTGSDGNGTLFTGSVCRIGLDNVSGCFPGYGNSVSQVAFKLCTVSPGAHLTYRYRSDSEIDSDKTSVIIDNSGACPVLQSTGFYAFLSSPGQRSTVATYEGSVEGVDDLPLPSGTVCIIVQSTSDASGSDADCNYDSRDGLFEFDNIQCGADLTTFDSGPNGWSFGALGAIAITERGIPVTGPLGTATLLLALTLTAFWTLGRRRHAAR